MNNMNPMQMISRFPQFMSQFRGQNPDAILQSMLQSGKINQNQLNQAQQQAQQMMTAFDQFKSMFGFR